MAFGLLDNLHSISSHSHEKKRISRLQRVGYAQRTGRTAIDSRGFEYEILDIYILGTCYAIRLEDLVRAIAEHGAVRIEELPREWKYYLGAHCGLARYRFWGKGLNIELFPGGAATQPRLWHSRIIESRERYAAIAKIPEQSVMPTGKIGGSSPDSRGSAPLPEIPADSVFLDTRFNGREGPRNSRLAASEYPSTVSQNRSGHW